MKAGKRTLLLLALAAVLSAAPVWACTTLIVTKGATTDGSTFVGHSDDDDLCDQRIVYVPAADHPKGARRPVYASAVALGEFPKFRCFLTPRLVDPDRAPAYGGPAALRSVPLGFIPQVPHTYAYFDGSYGIMNEHQLMFGECTDGVRQNLDPEPGKRIFYSSELSRVALERCRTAREAVRLMGNLLETYGYYGTGETLPVADPQEAWVMEMAPSPDGTGGLWVARRVPDGEVFVAANEFRIRDVDPKDPDLMIGSKLFETARRHGLWKPEDGPLDWLKVASLGEYNHPYYSLRRVWRVLDRVAPSRGFSPWVEDGTTRAYPFSVKPDRKLSVRDVMALYRDHYEGTPFDLTAGVGAGPFGNPDRFYGPYDGQGDVGDPKRKLDGAWERPISVTYCGYTTLCQGRSWLPDPIGGVCWIGPDKPSETCFIPFHAGVRDLPPSFQVVDPQVFNRKAAWWAFNFTAHWAWLRYDRIHADIAAKRDGMEASFLRSLEEQDRKALALHRTSPAKARDFLTRADRARADRTVADWWAFADRLIVRYNDGFLNEPGKMAQPLGYPRNWLDGTEWRTGPTTYAPKP